VSDADGRVQIDQRGRTPRLREAVRHGDDYRLLQPEHVTEIGGEVAVHRQLGGARVAEDGVETEVTQ